MILSAMKVALCGLVTVTSASVIQLPIKAQHNVDNSMFASGQVPLGRPVKVGFIPFCDDFSAP